MSRLRGAVVAGLIVVAGALQAQSWMVGPRGGINFAKQVGINGPSSELNGAVVGLSATRDYNDYNPLVTAQVELLYSQKGWRDGGDWMGLDYEIPLLLRLTIPLTSGDTGTKLGLRPFAIGGAAVGWRLNCYQASPRANPNYPNSESAQFDIECPFFNDTPHFERSLVYGVGVSYRRLRKHFTVEVRQGHGLNPLPSRQRNRDCLGGDCRLKNRVTSILTGVTLR
jgi:hypothetical protein